MSALSNELKTRFELVRSKIPPGTTLIAVSKTQLADSVEALYRLGQRDFGENYVQELLSKAQELERRGCTGIRWHFIGHLQTNKVRSLVARVHAIHSVDSLKLAQEISKRAGTRPDARKIPCFLEVNLDAEKTKSGFPPGEVQTASREISALPGIDLRGLMCIPAPQKDAQDRSTPFAALRELEKSCQPHTKGALSMGMSDDFEAALKEGSTEVRIGSLIFGSRKSI